MSAHNADPVRCPHPFVSVTYLGRDRWACGCCGAVIDNDIDRCCYCRQPITLIDGRGWVHDQSDTDRCWPDNPRDLTEAEPLVSAQIDRSGDAAD